MGQLQEAHAKLEELGYQIIAISPDRPEKVRAVADERKFDYLLLSDSELKTALALGVAYEVDPGTQKRLEGFGIDLEEASGRGHGMLPVPSVFLVSTDGIVDFAYVDPDYTRRIDPDVLLEAAKAAAE